jgi:NAD(P)-dependent dehydrogenase (short-subunit alcohol dehydrogenase family)
MSDTHILPHRHALITGAGSGIGAAIALTLAQQGYLITLAGRSRERLQEQAEQIRAQVPHLSVCLAPMDVTQPESVSAAVEHAQRQLGPIHVLVNNAGQALSQPFSKTNVTLWQQMLDVNLSGTFHCIQAVLPEMLQAARQGTPGRIINIASTAGLKGYAYVSAYVAAKHGVIGLTKALALELAGKGVTVNAICPGYTETDIVRHAIKNIIHKTGQSADQARQTLAARNPQQRLVQPKEVAQSVLWLCAAGSDAINGQALAIDGGELAG